MRNFAKATFVATVVLCHFLPFSSQADNMGSVELSTIPAHIEDKEIFDYVKVRPNIAVSGPIRLRGITRIERLGFDVVIDLRASWARDLDHLSSRLQQNNKHYVHIRTDLHKTNQAIIDELDKTLAQHSGDNILIFSTSFAYTSRIWKRYTLHRGEKPVVVSQLF